MARQQLPESGQFKTDQATWSAGETEESVSWRAKDFQARKRWLHEGGDITGVAHDPQLDAATRSSIERDHIRTQTLIKEEINKRTLALAGCDCRPAARRCRHHCLVGAKQRANQSRHQPDDRLLGGVERWRQLDGLSQAGMGATRRDSAQSRMDQAQLDGANLKGADLSYASLIKVSLRDAELATVKFTGADLSGANLGVGQIFPARI